MFHKPLSSDSCIRWPRFWLFFPIKYFATSLTSFISSSCNRCIWLDSALTHPDSCASGCLKLYTPLPADYHDHFFIFCFFLSIFPAPFNIFPQYYFSDQNRHSPLRQTIWPGGSIHQLLPSLHTSPLQCCCLVVMETNMEGPWKAPVCRSGALCSVCLRRPGARGLLWRVATLGEPHGLLFVWTRPLMPACSLAVAEKNEM